MFYVDVSISNAGRPYFDEYNSYKYSDWYFDVNFPTQEIKLLTSSNTKVAFHFISYTSCLTTGIFELSEKINDLPGNYNITVEETTFANKYYETIQILSKPTAYTTTSQNIVTTIDQTTSNSPLNELNTIES